MRSNSDSFYTSASRFVVIGTSGSGKTTLAKDLSNRLGIEWVELDAIRHGPDWVETPDEIFRQKVSEKLEGDRWVVDGNYSILRDIVWSRATTLIWLDYPFPLVIWRVSWRSIKRSILRTKLWNNNRETLWRFFFTKESLLLWVLKTHWRRRKTYPVTFALPQHSHLQVIRLKTPGQTNLWLEETVRNCIGSDTETSPSS